MFTAGVLLMKLLENGHPSVSVNYEAIMRDNTWIGLSDSLQISFQEFRGGKIEIKQQVADHDLVFQKQRIKMSSKVSFSGAQLSSETAVAYVVGQNGNGKAIDVIHLFGSADDDRVFTHL